MRSPIWGHAVCFKKYHQEWNLKSLKITPDAHKKESGLTQIIVMGKSIRHSWLKEFFVCHSQAKKIDFNPLREQDVLLPDGVTFVISNCCVEKNKAASSDFNTRVVECRLAAQVSCFL